MSGRSRRARAEWARAERDFRRMQEQRDRELDGCQWGGSLGLLGYDPDDREGERLEFDMAGCLDSKVQTGCSVGRTWTSEPAKPAEPKIERPKPRVRFTVEAWAKMQWLRDRGDTEVGMYGISSEGDPLLIERVEMVPQECTGAWCEFRDEGTVEFVDRMAQGGVAPNRCSRVWIHTHPGNSPTPSGQDERTFQMTFGAMNWAVMFILAKGGEQYSRLRVTAGGVSVDKEMYCGKPDVEQLAWERGFGAADTTAWEAEYQRCWSRKVYETSETTTPRESEKGGWRRRWQPATKEFEAWYLVRPPEGATWEQYVAYAGGKILNAAPTAAKTGTWVTIQGRQFQEFVHGLMPGEVATLKLLTEKKGVGAMSREQAERAVAKVVEQTMTGNKPKEDYVAELVANGELKDLLMQFGLEATVRMLRD